MAKRTGQPTINDVARLANVVRDLVTGGLVAGVHDVGHGGLGLALAEMAVRSGIGFQAARIVDDATLFSESPSRAVVCVEPDRLTTVLDVCENAGVPTARIGVATERRHLLDGPTRQRRPELEALTAWTTERGLPPGDVLVITQDLDGYLWLGTTSGLARFDGLQFSLWGAHGEPVLPVLSVPALTVVVPV